MRKRKPEMKELLERLREVEKTLNQGRGVRCVKDIIIYMDRGQKEDAQAVRQMDQDKTRQYPELEPLLRALFGCRQHGVHDCSDKWCSPQEI